MTNKDKILIKSLWQSKGSGAWQLIQAFPNKNWKRRGIEDLLRKLQETGLLDHRMGNGRARTLNSCEKSSVVEELTHFHKVV